MKAYKNMGKSINGWKSIKKGGLLGVFLIWFLFCSLMLASLYSTSYEWPNDPTLLLFRNHQNSFLGFQYFPQRFVQNSSGSMNLSPIPKKLLCDRCKSTNHDSCFGRYIYIKDIPSVFNIDIIKDCSFSNKWLDMCKDMINGGFGPITKSDGALQENRWYATNQFSLEIIFHNRMKQYKCLTNESSVASAIYVPYYAGLDVGRYLWDDNISSRDANGLHFANWISKQDEWKYMLGKDHFFVAGRIIWDFKRQTDNSSDWGSSLMLLPETKNMTVLIIESSPDSSNSIAVPYPTYFHPSSQEEVIQWQKKIKRQKRPYLYSFVGAPRPKMQDSIRGMVIDQCLASGDKCIFFNCNDSHNNCFDPGYVMMTFLNSRFCLQPSGDSYTRRSIFDSILGGCIPVFFHPEAAYTQFVSYLPKNQSAYSVFIPENDVRNGKVSIEKVLLGILENDVSKMQDEVIRLIPKVIYVDPKPGLNISEDAFDLAIKKILERVNKIRKMTKE